MRYTRRKMSLIALTLVLLGAVAIGSGCSGGDTATVTIDTGIYTLAKAPKLTLFDRVLAFLPFIKNAYAEPWPDYNLEITVSGAGMATFTNIVPSDTGILTLEVPSGPGRTFTAVAYSGGVREYGGIVTTDLAPGANVTLPIQMGLLPSNPDFSMDSVAPTTVHLSIYEASPDWGFYIYRAPDIGENPGAFSRIGKTGIGVTDYYDNQATNFTSYWY